MGEDLSAVVLRLEAEVDVLLRRELLREQVVVDAIEALRSAIVEIGESQGAVLAALCEHLVASRAASRQGIIEAAERRMSELGADATSQVQAITLETLVNRLSTVEAD